MWARQQATAAAAKEIGTDNAEALPNGAPQVQSEAPQREQLPIPTAEEEAALKASTGK